MALIDGRSRLASLPGIGLLICLLIPFFGVYFAHSIQADDSINADEAVDFASIRISASRDEYRKLGCNNPNELSSHPLLPARCSKLLRESDHRTVVTRECARYVLGARHLFGLLSTSATVRLTLALSAAVAAWGVLWWTKVKFGADPAYSYRGWRRTKGAAGQEGEEQAVEYPLEFIVDEEGDKKRD